MPLDEQTRTVRPTRRYLFFPWCALLLVWMAFETGMTDWILTVLPFGLGRIAIRNVWPGMLLLLIGCSALWAFKDQRNSDCRGVGLILGTIGWTLLVTLTQVSVAFAIYELLSVDFIVIVD